jgi:hypothetical protein
MKKICSLGLTCLSIVIALIILIPFAKINTGSFSRQIATLSLPKEQPIDRPKIEVPFDLKMEEETQKSVDEGHSPWRLDPIYVAQVFVSLKISPEGIKGDYPIKYEDLKLTYNSGLDAVVKVTGKDTPIRKVYLKKLIKQDDTGIWTVVGYDPV